MTYTETTTTGWLSRMKNALGGIIVGPILIIGCIVLLFWNEGRAIQTYRALVEGAGLVLSVDSGNVDANNDGKLVHISGPVTPNGTAADPEFGISAEGALAVRREVQMYQWVEKSQTHTEHNVGGSETTTTTYSYHKEWKPRRVDSSDFKQSGHDNPDFAVTSANTPVDSAAVGAFTMEGKAVAHLGNETQIKLTSNDVANIGSAISTDRPAKLNQGDVYLGNSATAPEIGDLKIRFERIDLKQASFVGKQQGDTLVPYTTSNGRDISLSAAGNVDAAAMFTEAQEENTLITWLIRVCGLVGIFVGFKLAMSILSVVGDVIPFIGSLIGGGTTILALVFTFILGPVVIAIGWFAYRPLLALSIIAVGAAVAAGFVYLRRKPASPATPQLGRAA